MSILLTVKVVGQGSRRSPRPIKLISTKKMRDNFYQRIYSIVQRIPKGKVATYGQIAALAGSPRGARMVGWALHLIDEEKSKKVPWQRVINREGRISTTCLEHPADLQKFLLVNEGVEIEEKEGNYWIDLKKFRWKP